MSKLFPGLNGFNTSSDVVRNKFSKGIKKELNHIYARSSKISSKIRVSQFPELEESRSGFKLDRSTLTTQEHRRLAQLGQARQKVKYSYKVESADRTDVISTAVWIKSEEDAIAFATAIRRDAVGPASNARLVFAAKVSAIMNAAVLICRLTKGDKRKREDLIKEYLAKADEVAKRICPEINKLVPGSFSPNEESSNSVPVSETSAIHELISALPVFIRGEKEEELKARQDKEIQQFQAVMRRNKNNKDELKPQPPVLSAIAPHRHFESVKNRVFSMKISECKDEDAKTRFVAWTDEELLSGYEDLVELRKMIVSILKKEEYQLRGWLVGFIGNKLLDSDLSGFRAECNTELEQIDKVCSNMLFEMQARIERSLDLKAGLSYDHERDEVLFDSDTALSRISKEVVKTEVDGVKYETNLWFYDVVPYENYPERRRALETMAYPIASRRALSATVFGEYQSHISSYINKYGSKQTILAGLDDSEIESLMTKIPPQLKNTINRTPAVKEIEFSYEQYTVLKESLNGHELSGKINWKLEVGVSSATQESARLLREECEKQELKKSSIQSMLKQLRFVKTDSVLASEEKLNIKKIQELLQIPSLRILLAKLNQLESKSGEVLNAQGMSLLVFKKKSKNYFIFDLLLDQARKEYESLRPTFVVNSDLSAVMKDFDDLLGYKGIVAKNKFEGGSIAERLSGQKTNIYDKAKNQLLDELKQFWEKCIEGSFDIETNINDVLGLYFNFIKLQAACGYSVDFTFFDKLIDRIGDKESEKLDSLKLARLRNVMQTVICRFGSNYFECNKLTKNEFDEFTRQSKAILNLLDVCALKVTKEHVGHKFNLDALGKEGTGSQFETDLVASFTHRNANDITMLLANIVDTYMTDFVFDQNGCFNADSLSKKFLNLSMVQFIYRYSKVRGSKNVAVTTLLSPDLSDKATNQSLFLRHFAGTAAGDEGQEPSRFSFPQAPYEPFKTSENEEIALQNGTVFYAVNIMRIYLELARGGARDEDIKKFENLFKENKTHLNHYVTNFISAADAAKLSYLTTKGSNAGIFGVNLPYCQHDLVRAFAHRGDIIDFALSIFDYHLSCNNIFIDDKGEVHLGRTKNENGTLVDDGDARFIEEFLVEQSLLSEEDKATSRRYPGKTLQQLIDKAMLERISQGLFEDKEGVSRPNFNLINLICRYGSVDVIREMHCAFLQMMFDNDYGLHEIAYENKFDRSFAQGVKDEDVRKYRVLLEKLKTSERILEVDFSQIICSGHRKLKCLLDGALPVSEETFTESNVVIDKFYNRYMSNRVLFDSFGVNCGYDKASQYVMDRYQIQRGHIPEDFNRCEEACLKNKTKMNYVNENYGRRYASHMLAFLHDINTKRDGDLLRTASLRLLRHIVGMPKPSSDITKDQAVFLNRRDYYRELFFGTSDDVNNDLKLADKFKKYKLFANFSIDQLSEVQRKIADKGSREGGLQELSRFILKIQTVTAENKAEIVFSYDEVKLFYHFLNNELQRFKHLVDMDFLHLANIWLPCVEYFSIKEQMTSSKDLDVDRLASDLINFKSIVLRYRENSIDSDTKLRVYEESFLSAIKLAIHTAILNKTFFEKKDSFQRLISTFLEARMCSSQHGYNGQIIDNGKFKSEEVKNELESFLNRLGVETGSLVNLLEQLLQSLNNQALLPVKGMVRRLIKHINSNLLNVRSELGDICDTLNDPTYQIRLLPQLKRSHNQLPKLGEGCENNRASFASVNEQLGVFLSLKGMSSESYPAVLPGDKVQFLRDRWPGHGDATSRSVAAGVKEEMLPIENIPGYLIEFLNNTASQAFNYDNERAQDVIAAEGVYNNKVFGCLSYDAALALHDILYNPVFADLDSVRLAETQFIIAYLTSLQEKVHDVYGLKADHPYVKALDVFISVVLQGSASEANVAFLNNFAGFYKNTSIFVRQLYFGYSCRKSLLAQIDCEDEAVAYLSEHIIKENAPVDKNSVSDVAEKMFMPVLRDLTLRIKDKAGIEEVQKCLLLGTSGAGEGQLPDVLNGGQELLSIESECQLSSRARGLIDLIANVDLYNLLLELYKVPDTGKEEFCETDIQLLEKLDKAYSKNIDSEEFKLPAFLIAKIKEEVAGCFSKFKDMLEHAAFKRNLQLLISTANLTRIQSFHLLLQLLQQYMPGGDFVKSLRFSFTNKVREHLVKSLSVDPQNPDSEFFVDQQDVDKQGRMLFAIRWLIVFGTDEDKAWLQTVGSNIEFKYAQALLGLSQDFPLPKYETMEVAVNAIAEGLPQMKNSPMGELSRNRRDDDKQVEFKNKLRDIYFDRVSSRYEYRFYLFDLHSKLFKNYGQWYSVAYLMSINNINRVSDFASLRIAGENVFDYFRDLGQDINELRAVIGSGELASVLDLWVAVLNAQREEQALPEHVALFDRKNCSDNSNCDIRTYSRWLQKIKFRINKVPIIMGKQSLKEQYNRISRIEAQRFNLIKQLNPKLPHGQLAVCRHILSKLSMSKPGLARLATYMFERGLTSVSHLNTVDSNSKTQHREILLKGHYITSNVIDEVNRKGSKSAKLLDIMLKLNMIDRLTFFDISHDRELEFIYKFMQEHSNKISNISNLLSKKLVAPARISFWGKIKIKIRKILGKVEKPVRSPIYLDDLVEAFHGSLEGDLSEEQKQAFYRKVNDVINNRHGYRDFLDWKLSNPHDEDDFIAHDRLPYEVEIKNLLINAEKLLSEGDKNEIYNERLYLEDVDRNRKQESQTPSSQCKLSYQQLLFAIQNKQFAFAASLTKQIGEHFTPEQLVDAIDPDELICVVKEANLSSRSNVSKASLSSFLDSGLVDAMNILLHKVEVRKGEHDVFKHQSIAILDSLPMCTDPSQTSSECDQKLIAYMEDLSNREKLKECINFFNESPLLKKYFGKSDFAGVLAHNGGAAIITKDLLYDIRARVTINEGRNQKYKMIQLHAVQVLEEELSHGVVFTFAIETEHGLQRALFIKAEENGQNKFYTTGRFGIKQIFVNAGPLCIALQKLKVEREKAETNSFRKSELDDLIKDVRAANTLFSKIDDDAIHLVSQTAGGAKSFADFLESASHEQYEPIFQLVMSLSVTEDATSLRKRFIDELSDKEKLFKLISVITERNNVEEKGSIIDTVALALSEMNRKFFEIEKVDGSALSKSISEGMGDELKKYYDLPLESFHRIFSVIKNREHDDKTSAHKMRRFFSCFVKLLTAADNDRRILGLEDPSAVNFEKFASDEDKYMFALSNLYHLVYDVLLDAQANLVNFKLLSSLESICSGYIGDLNRRDNLSKIDLALELYTKFCSELRMAHFSLPPGANYEKKLLERLISVLSPPGAEGSDTQTNHILELYRLTNAILGAPVEHSEFIVSHGVEHRFKSIKAGIFNRLTELCKLGHFVEARQILRELSSYKIRDLFTPEEMFKLLGCVEYGILSEEGDLKLDDLECFLGRGPFAGNSLFSILLQFAVPKDCDKLLQLQAIDENGFENLFEQLKDRLDSFQKISLQWNQLSDLASGTSDKDVFDPSVISLVPQITRQIDRMTKYHLELLRLDQQVATIPSFDQLKISLVEVIELLRALHDSIIQVDKNSYLSSLRDLQTNQNILLSNYGKFKKEVGFDHIEQLKKIKGLVEASCEPTRQFPNIELKKPLDNTVINGLLSDDKFQILWHAKTKPAFLLRKNIIKFILIYDNWWGLVKSCSDSKAKLKNLRELMLSECPREFEALIALSKNALVNCLEQRFDFSKSEHLDMDMLRQHFEIFEVMSQREGEGSNLITNRQRDLFEFELAMSICKMNQAIKSVLQYFHKYFVTENTKDGVGHLSFRAFKSLLLGREEKGVPTLDAFKKQRKEDHIGGRFEVVVDRFGPHLISYFHGLCERDASALFDSFALLQTECFIKIISDVQNNIHGSKRSMWKGISQTFIDAMNRYNDPQSGFDNTAYRDRLKILAESLLDKCVEAKSKILGDLDNLRKAAIQAISRADQSVQHGLIDWYKNEFQLSPSTEAEYANPAAARRTKFDLYHASFMALTANCDLISSVRGLLSQQIEQNLAIVQEELPTIDISLELEHQDSSSTGSSVSWEVCTPQLFSPPRGNYRQDLSHGAAACAEEASSVRTRLFSGGSSTGDSAGDGAEPAAAAAGGPGNNDSSSSRTDSFSPNP